MQLVYSTERKGDHILDVRMDLCVSSTMVVSHIRLQLLSEQNSAKTQPMRGKVASRVLSVQRVSENIRSEKSYNLKTFSA